ncbi:hypothetical protein [Nocardioides convexus]|uniref:hypothetical protein n=1 Tax=Nocardioides convexus TaxID=2712224 RepID=UPI002418BAF2|nr:hypothetical protein [Nocardioides convexus]
MTRDAGEPAPARPARRRRRHRPGALPGRLRAPRRDPHGRPGLPARPPAGRPGGADRRLPHRARRARKPIGCSSSSSTAARSTAPTSR